jgi:rhodanese-related sulfurtransferase
MQNQSTFQSTFLSRRLAVLMLFVGIGGAWASCGTGKKGNAESTPQLEQKALRAEDVNVERFAELIATAENPILLDVRSDGEWAAGHLPNASYIPFESADFEEQLAALDKDRPVLVYCASGGRSSRAMQILNQSGQTQVYNLLGGIRAWSAAGQPVVGGDPQPIQ